MKVFIRETGEFVELTENEERFLLSGKYKKPAIIFKVPPEKIVVKDIIRGDVKFPAGEIKDFIIKRKETNNDNR